MKLYLIHSIHFSDDILPLTKMAYCVLFFTIQAFLHTIGDVHIIYKKEPDKSQRSSPTLP